VITAQEVAAVRRAEAAAGRPDAVLMARAAAALAAVAADALRERSGGVYGRSVAVLAGSGSNGGDALLAGALLARRGAAVTALLAGERAHTAALAQLRAAGGRVVPAGAQVGATPRPPAALARAELVLDGLVGAGGRPGLSGPAAALARAVPPSAVVVAVDLPSGVGPDTGELPPDSSHVRADVTVTFGAAKPALLLPPAAGAAGRVVVADIGLPGAALGAPAVEQLEAADVAAAWPVPGRESDKYSRGVLGVVAGGNTYTGAAVLCTGAAVRAGAGMVRYVGPPRPTEIVRERWPEVVPGPGRVQAWAVGPGVDPDDGDQAPAVAEALGSGLPCLVDAGALVALAERVRSAGPVDAPVLLTPHAGELARLLSSLGTALGDDVPRAAVSARPLEHARAAADATGATVLLKGATTVLVAPDGRVRAQTDGPGWLGTAGAGDVLAGIAGTLLAAGLEPLDAGSVATAVHGRAAVAASGGGPLHAEAVSQALPGVLARLLTTGRWA
jgi:ADP-dependent NAD(P)H-hydrate dehydratase / NAD(P)H-hydrate epimerase